jgi:hypothetical protein
MHHRADLTEENKPERSSPSEPDIPVSPPTTFQAPLLQPTPADGECGRRVVAGLRRRDLRRGHPPRLLNGRVPQSGQRLLPSNRQLSKPDDGSVDLTAFHEQLLARSAQLLVSNPEDFRSLRIDHAGDDGHRRPSSLVGTHTSKTAPAGGRLQGPRARESQGTTKV